MSKLTIVRGLSGSGKSTWARQQNATVVSRDDLRVLLFPMPVNEYYEAPSEVFAERENKVTVAQDAMVDAFLRVGQDVIVDNTNIRWAFVKSLAKIGYRRGAEVELKVFDVPLETCLARNEQRGAMGGRYVQPWVIEKQYEGFKKNKNMTLDPVQVPIYYHGTPDKEDAILVDIDGTLAHMHDKRGPFEWHNVGVDDVDEVISDIVRMSSLMGHIVVIVSGRDEAAREETEKWLSRHSIPYEHLFMRPAGDMRPDNLIKAELFDKYIRDNFNVQFVLDDRQQVVDMWRRMGITCLQVAESFD